MKSIPRIEDSPKQVLSSSSLELTKAEQTEQILEQYQHQLEQQQHQLEQQQHQIDVLNQELEQKHLEDLSLKKVQPSVWQRIIEYFIGVKGSSSYQPRFSLTQVLLSYLGSFIGIAALAYLSIVSNYPLIAAPFGAAAVLVFAVPNSPLAQPRNLIFGNLVGGIVSILMVYLFNSEPWVMALSVATAIKIMQLTKTLHPPGGAVALVGVMSEADWTFLLTPVLAGSIILLFCTLAFNNIMPERSYPRHWL